MTLRLDTFAWVLMAALLWSDCGKIRLIANAMRRILSKNSAMTICGTSNESVDDFNLGESTTVRRQVTWLTQPLNRDASRAARR